jgi:hypothetical protein
MPKDIIVKRYKSQAAFQRDANRMRAKGYEVQDTTSEQPRGSCLRIVLGVLTLGIFALLWKPKPVIVVTYRYTGQS